MFETLLELYVFFTDRIKRVIAQKRVVESAESTLKLKNSSMTKWTSRFGSLTVLWTSFDTIAEILNELRAPNKDKIIKEKIQLLHRCVTCFGFILIVMFMRQVLSNTKILA